jgi:hypothetical protein
MYKILSVLLILTFVHSNYAVVCSGGSIQYSYNDLMICDSFTGVTSQTSINLNGIEITTLSSLNNIIFDRWPGTIRITNTSISSLSGLNLNLNIGLLEISNNQQLLTVAMNITAINSLKITNNQMLNQISFPILTGSTTNIEISNNTQLKSLTTFNSLLGIISLTIINNGLVDLNSFNAVSSGSTIIINEPKLGDFTAFKTIQTINTLMLYNLTVTEIVGWRVQRINSLYLQGLTMLQNLKFLSAVNTINNIIYITEASSLLDYSGLSSLIQMPSSFSFTGSCCPAYNQYSNVLTVNKFVGCIDCVEVSGLKIEQRKSFNTSVEIPSSGGIFLNISYFGSAQSNVVKVSYISQTMNIINTFCDIINIAVTNNSRLNSLGLNGIIKCVTPTLNESVYTLSFTINDKQPLSSNLTLNVVDTQQYLGISQVNDILIYNSELQIPGIITSQSTSSTNATYLVIGIMASLLFIIFVLFVLRKKIKNLSTCCKLNPCCNVKIFKLFDFYYTFNEGLGPDVTTNENRKNLMHPLGPLLHRKKTTFGGLMFLTSTFVSCCLIILLAYQTINDGLSTTVSLTPRINRIKSLYSGHLILSNFNRECTVGELLVDIKGFSTPTIITIQSVQDGRCKIEWITSQSADITLKSVVISITDKDQNSLFTGVEWSVSSIDHFGNPSVVNGYMKDAIFKAKDTQINLFATPTHYGGYNLEDLSGVLVSHDSQYPGTIQSLNDPITTNSDASGVIITMNIQLSPTDLSIIVALKQSILSTIGIGLSIISGSFTTGKILNILYHTIKGRVQRIRTPNNAVIQLV